MRRLFVPAERVGARVVLEPDELHYLRDVLRLQPGSPLEVFDGRLRHAAEVGADWCLVLRPGALAAAARALDVVLVQALAKGEKMELVIQKATELGVARIVPLRTERAVVRLDAARGREKAERWRRIAQEAARQCGRADVPVVDEPAEWGFVAQLLCSEPERRGLLLDPDEDAPRLSVALGEARRVLLAVGPEGGFSPAELETARAAGLVRAGLGPLVLRTETAPIAALAVLQHLAGDLG